MMRANSVSSSIAQHLAIPWTKIIGRSQMYTKLNTARAWVVAILGMLFSGCTVPQFEHTIETLEEATVPTELFGLYDAVNRPQLAVCTLLIEPADPGAPRGVVRVTMEDQTVEDTSKRTSRGYCIATRFDRSYVVQIPIFTPDDKSGAGPKLEREAWGDAKIAGYVFLCARLDSEELELAFIDSTFVERAIDQGKLRGSVKRTAAPDRAVQKKTDAVGKVTPEAKAESITVTADSESLRLFFQEHLNRGLFSETDNPRFKRKK